MCVCGGGGVVYVSELVSMRGAGGIGLILQLGCETLGLLLAISSQIAVLLTHHGRNEVTAVH